MKLAEWLKKATSEFEKIGIPSGVSEQSSAITYGISEQSSAIPSGVSEQSSAITTPRLDAEVLLMHILKREREFIYTYPETKLTATQKERLTKLLKRRLQREPIAYLVSEKEFFGLPFYVNHSVLIPRPETETLVEEAICLIRKEKPKNIYEVGTGSGAIAIATAKNVLRHVPWNVPRFIASDICKQALKVARKNIVRHGLLNKIELVHDNLGAHIRKRADLLIANLPYLPEKSYFAFKTELSFEPRRALFGGKDGLELYRKLLVQTKFKTAIIELGEPQQKRLLKKFIKEKLPSYQVNFKKDLGGQVRVAILHQT